MVAPEYKQKNTNHECSYQHLTNILIFTLHRKDSMQGITKNIMMNKNITTNPMSDTKLPQSQTFNNKKNHLLEIDRSSTKRDYLVSLVQIITIKITRDIQIKKNRYIPQAIHSTNK